MDSIKTMQLQEKIRHFQSTPPELFIHVDTSSQQLHVIAGTTITRSFTISTSQFGIGNRENSQHTPLGVHRIKEKIGEGAPAWRIFESRKDTGVDWEPGMAEKNYILSRILRLEGLEEGINRGYGIDSYDRYIYIHGTNREPDIGTPVSHGCICMKNNDIIELYNMISEGTFVIID